MGSEPLINAQQQYQYGSNMNIYNSGNNMQNIPDQQEQQLDINNVLMQEGYQNINQMSVVDRTRLWAEYKEKKIREAKEVKERQDQLAQDCTFKPQINSAYNTKRKTARQANQNEEVQQQSSKGLDKYLHRMNQARERKEEQQVLEEKLFKKGQNWKPKLTTPIEPNLTSFKRNAERDNQSHNNIRSLNKPVNPLQSSQQQQQQSKDQSDISKMLRQSQNYSKQQFTKIDDRDGGSGSQDQSQNDNNRSALSPGQIKNTKDFVKMAQRNKDQFVELRSDMHYEEAISLIHLHILNLDI
eukprot:403332763